ncbi:MAG: uroporphyrinogen decarboxylase family protein [Christensenellaceae bacterium]
MTSRERVRLALNHKEADRVPVDMWGSASRLDARFYKKLAQEMNFTELGELIRPGTATEYEDYRMSDIFGCDFRHITIGKPQNFKSYTNESGYLIDELGIGRLLTGDYPTVAFHPLKDADESALANYKWPNAKDPGRIAGLAERAKQYYEQTDCAITATSASSGQFFDLGQFMRGAEDFFMDLYINKTFAHNLIEKIEEFLTELNLYYLEPIAPYVEWVEFTSDFGTQEAPFISPDCFREFFKKPFERMFGAIKKKFPNMKIFLHSCGAIFDYIPDFIEMGVDVLNPLQPLANGMDSKKIKETFGNDVVLHGGIDIQQALIGNVDDVEKEVKKRLDAFAPGGGYIISTANHVQPDTPPENFIKMFEFIKKYGKYE